MRVSYYMGGLVLRCIWELIVVDRRRAWIYEVPLTDIHPLRHAINDSRLTTRDIINTVKKANVPIVAGTVKLYLLELNPPVLGWEGWEDAKAIYPAGMLLLYVLVQD